MKDQRMKLMEELRFRNATHTCPSCQGPAYCAMEAGKSANTCWCMTVEKEYNPEYDGEQCMCKECLIAK